MNVLILGYGKEGKAAEQYFTSHGHQTTILDPYYPDKANDTNFADFDLIIRSPIIRPRSEFSSSTQYFFDHCPAPIIGVTGTKGKGTTCTMIYELLKALGHHAYLLGNIGKPALDYLDKIKKNDVVVYEMSSFQLWDLTQSPHIAVVLRIEPDHLNVHKDFAEYVNAKGHIAEFQSKTDTVIYFKDNAESVKIAQKSPGRQIPYPLASSPELDQLLDSLTVPGQHNRENAEAALLAVAAYLDTSLEQLMSDHYTELQRGLRNFQGLPHHIELVRSFNGVEYYDDSFSTTEPSLEVALQSFNDRPLFLIAGGQDKGIDLAPIKQLIFGSQNLQKVLLLGEIKTKLAAGEDPQKYQIVDTLAEAVQSAQTLAEAFISDNVSTSVEQDTQQESAELARRSLSTPVVLLSPAAASLDMFESYYQRGDLFKQLVQALL